MTSSVDGSEMRANPDCRGRVPGHQRYVRPDDQRQPQRWRSSRGKRAAAVVQPHVAQGRKTASTYDRRSGLVRGAQYRCLLCLEFVLGEDPGVAELSEAFEPPYEHVCRQQS